MSSTIFCPVINEADEFNPDLEDDPFADINETYQSTASQPLNLQVLKILAYDHQDAISTHVNNKHNAKKSIVDSDLSKLSDTRDAILKRLLESGDSSDESQEVAEYMIMEVNPLDYYPGEPYKMNNKRKHTKWHNFTYVCEFCCKGYQSIPTLVKHSATHHGALPRSAALSCPCCPHVFTTRKEYKRHLRTHQASKGLLPCQYCMPIPDPSAPYVSESIKYPHSKYPRYWHTSERALILHYKKKHPYAGTIYKNWFCQWGDT